MPAMLDRPIQSPVLVGRQPQLGALHDLIDETKSGTGGAVLLSGVAGIGKSRLMGHVAAAAESLGFALARSACFEPDKLTPYSLLADLLPTEGDRRGGARGTTRRGANVWQTGIDHGYFEV